MTCFRAGRSLTFSAKTSSSARSCSICSRASGRCTFTTTGSPFARIARWTSAIVPAASGLWLDVVEHVLPRHAELLLHDLHHLLLGEGRDVILERGELLDELRRKQVGSRREDLPELRERRPELLERRAKALGLAPAPDRALLVRTAEQLLQPVLREDSRDLRAARHQVRLGLLLQHRASDHRRRAWIACHDVALAPRGVHDDHRASRVVADPVRHVAEQELLAPGHPGVADHEHVDVVVLGRVHDRHGRVVVDHDVGPSPFARQTDRLGLELVGGGSSPGGLGRAVLGRRRVRGHDDLDQVQLGAVALGERARPSDRARGGLGAVGRDHDPPHPVPADVPHVRHGLAVCWSCGFSATGRPPWPVGWLDHRWGGTRGSLHSLTPPG